MTLSPQRRCEGRLTAASPLPHRRPAPLFSSARPGHPRGVGPPAIPRSASALARPELPAPRYSFLLRPDPSVPVSLCVRRPRLASVCLPLGGGPAAWLRASRWAAAASVERPPMEDGAGGGPGRRDAPSPAVGVSTHSILTLLRGSRDG